MHSKPGAVQFRVEASLLPRPAVSASFMRYCLIAPLFTYGALFQRAQAEIQENHAPPSDTGKSTLARLNESDPPPGASPAWLVRRTFRSGIMNTQTRFGRGHSL